MCGKNESLHFKKIEISKIRSHIDKFLDSLLALSALLTLAVSGSAQSALIDRGNGLIYDDVLE